MIKGSYNQNTVSSAITSLFSPRLNAAPPQYEKQVVRCWSTGTADTPSTQSSSFSSSKRSTWVLEKIRKLVWGGQTAPHAHSPRMSWGSLIKRWLTSSSVSFIVFVYCDKTFRPRVTIQSSGDPLTPLLSWLYGHVTVFTYCKRTEFRGWMRTRALFQLWAESSICCWTSGTCLSVRSGANIFMFLSSLCGAALAH